MITARSHLQRLHDAFDCVAEFLRRGFRPTRPRSLQAFSERHACATLWRSLAHRYPIKPYRSPRRPFAADHPPMAWNPTGRRRLHRRRSRWPGWLRTLRLHDGLTLCCLARRAKPAFGSPRGNGGLLSARDPVNSDLCINWLMWGGNRPLRPRITGSEGSAERCRLPRARNCPLGQFV